MIMISEKYVFSILIKAVTGRGGENAMTEKISTCAVGFYSYTTKLGAQIGRVDFPLAKEAPLQNPACGFPAPGSLQS